MVESDSNEDKAVAGKNTRLKDRPLADPVNKDKAMPVKKMKELLDDNGIKYVTFQHSPAYTAQEIAQSAHISGKNLAKVVMLNVDDRMAMAVVPASHQVNLESLKGAANANTVELASEQEFKGMFPDCDDRGNASIWKPLRHERVCVRGVSRGRSNCLQRRNTH